MLMGAGVGYTIFCERKRRRQAAKSASADQTIEDSFPASDPPSWTGTTAN
jgi:hypothetical protein